jgi:hypothetical protein
LTPVIAGTGVGVGIGFGAGLGAGLGVGVGLGVGLGVGRGVGVGLGVGLGVGVGFGVAVGVGCVSTTFWAVVGCTAGTDVSVACREAFCCEPEPDPKAATGQTQHSIVIIMSVAQPIPSLDILRWRLYQDQTALCSFGFFCRLTGGSGYIGWMD